MPDPSQRNRDHDDPLGPSERRNIADRRAESLGARTYDRLEAMLGSLQDEVRQFPVFRENVRLHMLNMDRAVDDLRRSIAGDSYNESIHARILKIEVRLTALETTCIEIEKEIKARNEQSSDRRWNFFFSAGVPLLMTLLGYAIIGLVVSLRDAPDPPHAPQQPTINRSTK